MEDELYDVVVVGAGFAGLTAARELSRQGLSVRIVEARDRIGGRTWLDHRLGRDLEIGGTWVHWTQPYVWAELKRYGLDTTPSPEPERAFWWAAGRRHEGGPDELLGLIGGANRLFVQDSRKYFPAPFSPLSREDYQAIDDVSVQDRIREQFPAGAQREILESFWVLNFNGPLENAALTQALRWVALTNGDWAVNFEACATYKIVGGTAALAAAILVDSGVGIEHGFTVHRVHDDGASVSVHSTDGRSIRARTAIVTVPLHAMHAVNFEPPLSAAKNEGLSLGQVSKGAKVWIRLKGDHPPFVALGGADWPLNFFQAEYGIDGDTIVVGFGPDAANIDVADVAAVQEQLVRLVPDAEVVGVAGHNWVDDPLSGETWPMHATGFLSRHLHAMQEAHGAVLFAGSDIANGWGGFMDGAIESGMEAALSAAAILRESDPRAVWPLRHCTHAQQLIAPGQGEGRVRCHAGFIGACPLAERPSPTLMTVKKDPMSISNSESRTTEAAPRTEHSTALRAGSIGVMGILFFVLSAQAPLTGIVGASPLAAALGNGAGAPGAYLIVGIVIVIFAVGFVAMSRKIQANGAFYAYVTAAFGRKVGAGAAWLALLAYSTVQAAMYGLYGAAFSGLLASIGLDVPWWLLALVTMAGVQVLGSLNIELGARVLALLVGLEVAVLLMFGFTVLFRGGGPEGLSLAASFSPEAIATGAPGVAIMFAVASMFGFESTAIYSAEAKDAHRTVARATYLSVGVISVFFSFISWMLVSYYGPSRVIDAAGAALESGDSTAFVLTPMVELFGPWAGITTGILLVTSLLAGIIAFHNGINRYLHSLALRGSLPAIVARTNRHRAPAAAAWIQSATAVVLVVPFAVLALDPVLTLFSWFSGLAVAALLVLYMLCSIAVVGFFRRERVTGQLWQTLLAPALASVLLAWVLYLVVSNFTSLIGGSAETAVALLVAVPVVFAAGVLVERQVERRRGLAALGHAAT